LSPNNYGSACGALVLTLKKHNKRQNKNFYNLNMSLFLKGQILAGLGRKFNNIEYQCTTLEI